MTDVLKPPLDINQVSSSATFFRTHLGHRENATQLAIKLIRRAIQIERIEHGVNPVVMEFTQIAERWAIGHIVQGCYIEEYHQWEKAVKQYFKAQRELNGLQDDFDWRSGNKSMIQRARESLMFFSVSIDEAILKGIDSVRETVNDIKHDPLVSHVEESNYWSAINSFKSFWEKTMEVEGTSFG